MHPKIYHAWVVVEVQSGIPVSVRSFTSYETAKRYSYSLRRKLNLEDDETGIFEIELAEAGDQTED